VETGEECLDALADTFAEQQNLDELRSAPRRATRPEARRDAASKLLTFTEPNGGEKLALYNECRVNAEGTAFTAQFIASFDAYPNELPLWQETLDGIEIDAPSELVDETHRDPNVNPDLTETVNIATQNYEVEVAYEAEVRVTSDHFDGVIDHLEFDSDYGQAQVMAVSGNRDAAIGRANFSN